MCVLTALLLHLNGFIEDFVLEEGWIHIKSLPNLICIRSNTVYPLLYQFPQKWPSV